MYNPLKSTHVAFKASLNSQIKTHKQHLMFYQEIVELNVDRSVNFMHPFCLAAKTGKNNTFNYHQAMQQDDRDEFIKGMQKELQDHIQHM